MPTNYIVNSKFAHGHEGIIQSDTLQQGCAVVTGEAYYNLWNFLDKLEGNPPTVKGYNGAVEPAFGRMMFDFDAANPEDALQDARGLVQWLNAPHIEVMFSGSKGFHVAVPAAYFGLPNNSSLPGTMKRLAARLKLQLSTLDSSIYTHVRKFRVLNSVHPKTGLYKTLFDISTGMTIDQFKIWTRKSNGRSFANLPILQPLQILTDLIKELPPVDAPSTEVAPPTTFERFDNKKCIKKMWKAPLVDHGRNNIALILINDCFKTGITEVEASAKLEKWAAAQNYTDRDIFGRLRDVYSGKARYDHGCTDPIKHDHCTAKCDLWRKIHPDKRPQVADAPAVKDSLPTAFEVSEKLLALYENRIIKQERDLFVYHTPVWKHLQQHDLDAVKVKINSLLQDKASARAIEDYFKTFLYYVPAAPCDMWEHRIHGVNFRDGVLEIPEFKFREHRKDDYFLNVIDQNYVEGETNTEFDELLKRIFSSDKDKKKIQAISEMFGAALVPIYPRLFFLFGVSGSGKTTVMLLLQRLIGSMDYISCVDPTDFTGFGMETMAGKTLNMVTDIESSAPIKASVVKQIDDRTAVLIRRKGIKDILAPIPAVHIFGANELPHNFDGSTRAYKRRVTVIEFKRPHQGKKYRDIVDRVYHAGPGGILSFALAGLRELVKRGGYYLEFESSTELVDKWEAENDPVQMFLNDVREGEVEGTKLNPDKYGKMKGTWDIFVQWRDESGRGRSRLTKSKFYAAMHRKGYPKKTRDGYSVFMGIHYGG